MTMRFYFVALLLLSACATNKFTVSTDAEARDIATTALNAHVAGKMWRGGDGVMHAYRTFSPSDWTRVNVDSDAWHLVMRPTNTHGYFAVLTINRRNRQTRIESCGHTNE